MFVPMQGICYPRFYCHTEYEFIIQNKSALYAYMKLIAGKLITLIYGYY